MEKLSEMRDKIKSKESSLNLKRVMLGYESDFELEIQICESKIDYDAPCKNERDWEMYTSGKRAGMKWYRDYLKGKAITLQNQSESKVISELTDKEISLEADKLNKFDKIGYDLIFTLGAKWYREQLKQRQ